MRLSILPLPFLLCSLLPSPGTTSLLHQPPSLSPPPSPPIYLSASSPCTYGLNVTLHVPPRGHIVHNNGRLTLTTLGSPTRWTLSKLPSPRSGWHIYYTHPAGNRHYWSGLSGQEINIHNQPREIQIAFDNLDEGRVWSTFFWEEFCIRFPEDGTVRMNWNTQCENVEIRPTRMHGWREGGEMCEGGGGKGFGGL